MFLVPISAALLHAPTWAVLHYLSTSATLLNVPSLVALLLVLTSIELLPSRLWLCCFYMWAEESRNCRYSSEDRPFLREDALMQIFIQVRAVNDDDVDGSATFLLGIPPSDA